MGECLFHIDNINKADNGTWHCYYARDMGEPFDKIAYEVNLSIAYLFQGVYKGMTNFQLSVAENVLYYQEIDVVLGEEANLLCSTHGVSIKHCIYESPSSDIYYVFNNATSGR